MMPSSPKVNGPVRVLVVGPAPPGPTSRGGMATVIGHMLSVDDPRVEIRHLTTYLDAPTGTRLRVGLGGMARGVLTLTRRDADVLHVHLSHGGSVLRKSPLLWAARLRGVPAVIHGHSFDFGGWVSRLPRLLRPVVRAALPADRWLVLGTALAQEYRTALNLPDDDVEVLYNPVPAIAAADRTVPPGERIEVVALGRLGVRKGSYDLLAALESLPPAVRERVHLTLAGDGEVDAVLAAAASLGDAVTVRDWLDPDARDAALAAAQVFALPSYEEGLPMALLEAMAAGLVPLSTPVGGIGEVVSDGVNGILVTPGDVPALADAIAAVATDDALRERLADGALTRASDFAMAAWQHRLSELWTSLARR